jgi:hypothetical protein
LSTGSYGAATLVGVSRIAYVLTDTIDDDVIINPVLDKRKNNFEILVRLGLSF